MLEAFFIAIGVSCALTTLLAIFLVIVDAVIANYGEVKITINDNKELQIEGGKSLLSSLKDAKIFIPSACGGRGSCGLCKIKISEGAGSLLPTELPWLNDEEIKENIRISCQIKVKSDLRIFIPEELFSVKQFETKVALIRDLTHDIKEVRLKLQGEDEINYKPGQYIQFEVPEYELTSEPIYRAYSMSGDPLSKKEIELVIKYVPEGICTTYVHRYLKPNDTVIINGPYGDFYLRDTTRDIIFVAGGSGMAPIKSILIYMRNNNITRRARYFFGARSKRDLYFVPEMREMEKLLADFIFIPALSEPKPEDNWRGETGLITEVVSRYYEKIENTEAYLCGPPLMIDACIEILKNKGLTEELIYYDKF